MITTRSGRVVKPVIKPTIKPTITKKPKPATKTLDLTLDVDNQDKININTKKIKADWADENYQFYKSNFFTPKDDITKRYDEIVTKMENLPVVFMNGIANFEIKPEKYLLPKQEVLYSKLINKDYEIDSSKSDKNIASSIKFIYNNLPSFKKYKTIENLDYIIKEHRLLVTEILEYAHNNNNKLATIKTRLVAMARIFRIAYKTKNYPLYDILSVLIIMISQYIDLDEGDNKLNEIEQKKFIDWSIVLQKRDQLEIKFNSYGNKLTKEAYDTNQKLLLLAIYSYIPPLRLENYHLRFTTTAKEDYDYVFFKQNDVILDYNLNKKRHDPIMFNLSKIDDNSRTLAKILKESYELYPREYLFTTIEKYPDLTKKISVGYLSNKLRNLFLDTNLSVSVNSLRSSYVSGLYSKRAYEGRQLTINEKNKIAERMRTSRTYLDESYNKILTNDIYRAIPLDDEPKIKKEPDQPNIQNNPDENNAYKKQKITYKKYYDKNKDQILEQQKKYRTSKPAGSEYLKKILQYLNADTSRYEKTKLSTIQKYNIELVNGKYVGKIQ